MVKSAAAEADDEQGDDAAGVDQDVGLDFVSYFYLIGNKTKIQVQLWCDWWATTIVHIQNCTCKIQRAVKIMW